MKPIVDCPDLHKLAKAIELCDEIIANQAQAKIIILSERQFIIEVRRNLIKKFRKLSQKAIYG